jgi:hypothetical protein
MASFLAAGMQTATWLSAGMGGCLFLFSTGPHSSHKARGSTCRNGGGRWGWPLLLLLARVLCAHALPVRCGSLRRRYQTNVLVVSASCYTCASIQSHQHYCFDQANGRLGGNNRHAKHGLQALGHVRNSSHSHSHGTQHERCFRQSARHISISRLRKLPSPTPTSCLQ